jgi:hypothetical protein
MPGAIVNDIKDTSQLGYMGAVVMTSSQTTVLQKIEGAAVMVSAVVDVASNFTGIEGAGKAVVKDVAKDVAKDAIKSAAKDATHDAVDSGVKNATKEGAESGTAKIEEATDKNASKASSTPEQSAQKTYQTYTKTNPDTGEVYTGRTSGKGTPEENVLARDKGHHMNDKGFGPAQLDKSSANRDAIRGREQQMIDANGGAKSAGGTSGNAIRGVSKINPKAGKYKQAADKEFGN